jgi:hypothetical protein
VAITGSSLVRIASDSACHVAIGTNPVADQNSMYIPANTVELIFIPNGWKLGVINHTGSPGGSLWLTKAV